MDGLGMMLKSMGLDVEKAQKDFEQLKTAVTGTLAEISKRLGTLEAQQQQILNLVQEHTAWQRKMTYILNGQQSQPAPPQLQPHQPQPVQTEHTPQP
jgi:hypothetical protein